MSIESGGLKRKFMSYIIPSVAAQWVYTLYTMVDGLFVARGVTEVAMTAVNIANPFVQLMFAISLMFAVGTCTFVAIAIGEGNIKRGSELFTQNIVFLLVLSAAIGVGAFALREPLARFLGAEDEETVAYVVEYLSWIVPFAPFYILSYSFEILIKTDGFPRKATMLVLMGAVCNCILDWLFVIVLKKGVAGAAFATSISQGVVIVLYLMHFMSDKGMLHFRRFRLHPGQLARQARNGLSSGLTELSSSVVTFAFNRVILAVLSSDALVGYTIVSYVNAIVVMSATGIAQGAQPLIGICCGQRDAVSCRRLLRYSITAAGIFCTAAFALCFAGANVIVSMFVRPELQALRAQCTVIFSIFSLSFLVAGYNVVISGFFTSVNRPVPALTISVGRVAVMLVCLFGLAAVSGSAIWWTPLMSEAICFAGAATLLARGIKGRDAELAR